MDSQFKKKLKGVKAEQCLFAFLLILVLFLTYLNVTGTYKISLRGEGPIIVHESKIIDLREMTLRQKISQMLILFGQEHNLNDVRLLNPGGVYVGAISADPQGFKDASYRLQENKSVPFFIVTDMEGCINPFSAFRTFKAFKDINTTEEAYQAGLEEGQLMNELGFNLNFAPVVDLEDYIWKCRSFNSGPVDVAEKAEAYIKGMHESDVLVTIKHYPGKTLLANDPHKEILRTEIEDRDVYPFEYLSKKADAVMPSHQITGGVVDTDGKPADVSNSALNTLRKDFNGLIITDDIQMLGLKKFYGNDAEMYIDLFNTDNDMIIFMTNDLPKVDQMVSIIEQAVKDGKIDEKRIDRSVIKILTAKGYTVL